MKETLKIQYFVIFSVKKQTEHFFLILIIIN